MLSCRAFEPMCVRLAPPPSSRTRSSAERERDSAKVEVVGSNPTGFIHEYADVAQLGRGVRLKSEKLRVRISPSATLIFMRRWRKQADAPVSDAGSCGFNSRPPHQTFFQPMWWNWQTHMPEAHKLPPWHPTRESGGNRQTHEAQTFAFIQERESSNLSSRINPQTYMVNGDVGKLV